MKSNMKKNLIKLGVMLAATFSLTNCTEEITAPTPDVEKGPYTIYANAPETKTVNDGLSTNWAEGDALNVSHAPTGTLGLSYNTMFTLTDAETGRFDTEYLEGELVVSNDWYALYPYNEKIEYLNKMAEAGVYFTLGSAAVGATQTQKGNDNMKHIAGENYPMYGVVRESLSEEFPSFMMSHVSSLIEVKVTNNVDDEIVVSSVSFTATEDVVGTYYIDITGDEPAFTGTANTDISRMAILAVEDGEPIAMGESASFYLAVKPFTAPAGSMITVDVNGTPKTIALDYDVTFAEGKIKTINFDFDKYVVPGNTTTNLTWTLGEYAYDHNSTPKNNAQTATVNGTNITEMLKLGSSKATGTATLHIPAGTTKIGFYAASWKGKSSTLVIQDASSVVATIAPPANDGFTSNPNYTVELDEAAHYYEVTLNASVATDYTVSSNDRVVLWGVNYYTADGLGEDIEPEPEPEPEPEGPVEATVAEFSAAENGDTVYELSGTITEIDEEYNANYNNISFVLSDETGEVLIFRMSCEGIEDPTAISVGDEITVQGTKTTYDGAPQMAKGGKCIKFEDTAKPEPEPEPSEPIEATVEDVLAAEPNDNVWYQITGIIRDIHNTTYGNFYLEGDSGKQILVYGLTATKVEGNDKSFATLGLKNGDVLTLVGTRDDYNGTAQIGGPAYYISHEAGEEEPEVSEPQVVTVAEFLAANESTTTIYELTGIIARITTPYDEGYNNISFVLSDDTGEVTIFRMSCEGVEDPTSLTVGDEITLQGCRGSYNGAPQMAQGGKYISHVDNEAPEQEEGTYVLDFSDKANRTSYSTQEQIWEQNGIKLTNNKAAATSNVGDYVAPARFYKYTSLTIEKAGMSKIVFNLNSGKPASGLINSINDSNAKVTADGYVVTISFAETVDVFEIASIADQFRVDNLLVYAD